MKKSIMYAKALTNIAVYLVAALLVIFLLPKVIVFFLPFVIGWLVSCIANPPVKFMEEKIKFKRKATSAIFIVLIIALIIFAGYGIIVFLVNQGMGLAASIPEKWGSWQNSMDNIAKSFNTVFKDLPKEFKEPLNNFGNSLKEGLQNFVSGLGSSEVTSNVVGMLSSGIGSIAGVIIGIIMSVLSAYLFTVEHNNLAAGIEKVIPKTAYSKIMAAYRGLKNAVGGYFLAQIKIEVWVYVITMIGLLICRIDFAVIIALGIAILDFLPFFGAGAVMVPWAIIALINGEYLVALGMGITWGVGQLVRQLIQPRIVGAEIGLPPLPTLLLLFVGYKVMGVFGMVVAIPIAMIFISLYHEGLFVNFIRSIRIIWDGVSSFRRLPNPENEDK